MRPGFLLAESGLPKWFAVPLERQGGIQRIDRRSQKNPLVPKDRRRATFAGQIGPPKNLVGIPFYGVVAGRSAAVVQRPAPARPIFSRAGGGQKEPQESEDEMKME